MLPRPTRPSRDRFRSPALQSRSIHETARTNTDRAAPFRLIAADMGVSAAQLAHRYALSMPGVETVVLGVKNRQELADCLLAEAAPALEDSVVQRIDTAVRN